jgi:predicted transcriptional regulator
MNVAQGNVNNEKYFNCTNGMLKLDIPSLAAFVLGTIDGYARTTQKKRYRATLSAIASDYGCSVRQISRTVKMLDEKGYITREYDARYDKCVAYASSYGGPRANTYKIPIFLLNREFNIINKDKKTGEVHTIRRRLTRIEATFVVLLASICGENGKFKATMRKFAKMVQDISPMTAQKAISNLLHADIIARPKTATHRAEESEYTFKDKDLLKEIRKVTEEAKARRAEKAKMKEEKGKTASIISAQEQAVKDADAKSARERFYALRREQAEIDAARIQDKLNKIPKFAAAMRQINQSEIHMARLEIAGDVNGMRALRIQCAGWRHEIEDVLQDFGYTQDDLKPKRICLKCSDTGYLPDGKACDCYPKGGTT